MSAKETIESELENTGIPVFSKDEADSLPTGLAVVVGKKPDTVAVSFRKKNVGYLFRTEGKKGDKIWQSKDVDSIVSEDLHRVAFHVASLHPPINNE